MSHAEEIESAAPAPWSGVTLVDLFVSTANLNGQALAFAGFDCGGRVMRRTYAEAAQAVDNIVHRIDEIGLEPGSRVAVAMGASVEAPLAILAVLKAGMTPCLTPTWLPREALSEALRLLGARAIVSVGAVGDVRPAEALRAAAAMLPDGPRFLLAFGDRLPAGVTPLSDALIHSRDTGFVNAFENARPGPRPVLTLDLTPAGPIWATHAQEMLIASALGVVTRGDLGAADPILTTLAPLTLAGLATGLIPALLTGATLHLHGPFDAGGLLQQLSMMVRPHLVAPAALERGLHQAELLGGAALSSAVLVHRAPARLQQRERPRAKASPIIDVLALRETALLLGPRREDGAADVSLASLRVPDATDGALVTEARVERGRLQVRGEGVSGGSPETGWADPGLVAKLEGDRIVSLDPA